MIRICSSCLESPALADALTAATIARGDAIEHGVFRSRCLAVVSSWPGFTLTLATSPITDSQRIATMRSSLQYIGDCNRLLGAAKAACHGSMGMGFLSEAERDEQEASFTAGEPASQFVTRVLAARQIGLGPTSSLPRRSPRPTNTTSAVSPRRHGRDLAQRLSDASKCRQCGKPRLTLNTAGARQRFHAETVTLDTHCACEDGPAAHLRQAEFTSSEGESA